MELERIAGAFAQLGKVLGHLGRGEAWPGEPSGLTRQEYDDLELLVKTANIANGFGYVFNEFGLLGIEDL